MGVTVVTGTASALLAFWRDHLPSDAAGPPLTIAAHPWLATALRAARPTLPVAVWDDVLPHLLPSPGALAPQGWELGLASGLPSSIVNAMPGHGAPGFASALLEALALVDGEPRLRRELLRAFPLWRTLWEWVKQVLPEDLWIPGRVYQYADADRLATGPLCLYGFSSMSEGFYAMLARWGRRRSVWWLWPTGPESLRDLPRPLARAQVRRLESAPPPRAWTLAVRDAADLFESVADVVAALHREFGYGPGEVLVVEEDPLGVAEVGRWAHRLGWAAWAVGDAKLPGRGWRLWRGWTEVAQGRAGRRDVLAWLDRMGVTVDAQTGQALRRDPARWRERLRQWAPARERLDWMARWWARGEAAEDWGQVARWIEEAAAVVGAGDSWELLRRRVVAWQRLPAAFFPPFPERQALLQQPFSDPVTAPPPEAVWGLPWDALDGLTRPAVIWVGRREADGGGVLNPWLAAVGWDHEDRARAALQATVLGAQALVVVALAGADGRVRLPPGAPQAPPWPERSYPAAQSGQPVPTAPSDQWPGEVGPWPLPATLSPSALETFGRCPLAYFLRHQLDLGEGGAEEDWAVPPATRGLWVHEALAGLPDWLWAAGDWDALRAGIRDGILRARALYPPPEGVPDWVADAVARRLWAEAAEAVWRARSQWVGRENLGREMPVVWEAEAVRVVGRVDRLDRLADGTVEVVDFKTGDVEDPIKVGPDNLQLALYREALLGHAGGPRKVAVRVMGLSARHRFRLRAVGADADWPGLKPLVQEMVALMRAGHFWPVPHGRPDPCRSCDYRLVCPAGVAEAALRRAALHPERVRLWHAHAESGGEGGKA
ncbi:MAG: PD-(D/E)XK nuclease family protein [Firmicutes bacterium]|nr:PD-(D/E)XK nuclease family protein [Alicyclobacillaceae bacterium]MCL6497169.1 PD-(D/E)XK nuclease family protein [Bacillota bacterium]